MNIKHTKLAYTSLFAKISNSTRSTDKVVSVGKWPLINPCIKKIIPPKDELLHDAEPTLRLRRAVAYVVYTYIVFEG